MMVVPDGHGSAALAGGGGNAAPARAVRVKQRPSGPEYAFDQAADELLRALNACIRTFFANQDRQDVASLTQAFGCLTWQNWLRSKRFRRLSREAKALTVQQYRQAVSAQVDPRVYIVLADLEGREIAGFYCLRGWVNLPPQVNLAWRTLRITEADIRRGNLPDGTPVARYSTHFCPREAMNGTIGIWYNGLRTGDSVLTAKCTYPTRRDATKPAGCGKPGGKRSTSRP